MEPEKQFNLLDLIDQERRSPIDGLLTPDQIFDSEDVGLFLRLTEDARFDRKSAKIQPAGLAPVVSAFSNGPSIGGGIIVVGISNNKQLEGCRGLSSDRLMNLEAAAMTYCALSRVRSRRLAFTHENGDGDFLTVFRVQYIPERLIETSNGDAYQRIGDKSVKLSEQAKHQIRIDKGERSFEQEPCGLEFFEEFSLGATKKFCNLVRESRKLTSEHSDISIFDALRLGRWLDGSFVPNNACALLFAKDPLRVFPGAYIRFLRHEGTEEKSGSEYNVTKDRKIEGTIGQVIKDTAQLIDANLREFTEFRSGKFYSVFEYPRDAWYELLVNACVHRSYLNRNVPIFIRMFDDRLSFESPGGFMPGVTPENIYERHNPRNPFIMSVLMVEGEVKCINEGTKRVRKEMAQAKLPAPVFFEKKGDNTSFVAVLKNNVHNRSNTLDSKAYAALGDALTLTLSINDRKILNYIMANERITSSDALRILTTTRWGTAKKLLDSLVARGILKFNSTKSRDPNAFYELTKAVGDE